MAQVNVELFMPGIRILRGDAVIAVVMIIFQFPLPGLSNDHTFFVRLLVSFAADRGSEDGDLDAHRPGLAKIIDLIKQAVEVALAGQGLAVVVHHHRHRTDAQAVQDFKKFPGFFRTLSLLDQFGGHVLDAEPDGPQTAVAAKGQQVLVLEYIELGRFRSEEDGVAEGLAVDLAFGHARK